MGITGPEESEKNFIFGSKGHLKSEGEYTISGNIRGQDFTIGLDVVNSDIPLLLSSREMRKLGVKLNLAEDEVKNLGITATLLTTNMGLPAVQLHTERRNQGGEEVNEGKLDENKREEENIFTTADTGRNWNYPWKKRTTEKTPQRKRRDI